MARQARPPGRLWFYVSGGTVEGDENPTFGPGDVDAAERFVALVRAQRREEA